MIKPALALFRLLACAALLGCAGAAAIAQSPTPPAGENAQPRRVVIRFLTESEFPPFNYYDDEGVLTGFNVDLARAICFELQTACDIKVKPWEDLLAALERGDADAVIASHAITSKALARVDFSDRYFHTPGRFVTRSEDPRPEISPEGLDGVGVGVAKGTTHEAFLRANFPDSRIVTFENQDLAREALQQKKVDAVFDDAISLSFWLNGSLSRKCCEFAGGAYFEPKFFGDGIAIAVARNDIEVRTLINSGLESVRQSGRFQELIERYFPLRIY